MGNNKVGSRNVKIIAMVGFASAVLLAAGAAGTSRAQNANDNGSASSAQAKKCGVSGLTGELKKDCPKHQPPTLARGEAIAQALGVGRIEAKRPVKVSRATRIGRSSFSVVVAWAKRPPIGIQGCSLELTVSKKWPRTFVASFRRSGCDSIRMHKDLNRLFQRGPGAKYCPADVENSWNAKVLEGMTLEEATVIAAENGCLVRIARQDGVDLAVTKDFRVNRLNLDVEGPDQRIVRIMSVG